MSFGTRVSVRCGTKVMQMETPSKALSFHSNLSEWSSLVLMTGLYCDWLSCEIVQAEGYNLARRSAVPLVEYFTASRRIVVPSSV
jgi:hypothetical protein